MPLDTKPTDTNAAGTVQEPEPVKRNYNDLDGLLSEMGQPKQTFDIPAPPGSDPAQPGESAAWQPPYQEPINHEEALRSGKRLAKTLDSTFAFLAGLYAKSEDTSKYKATAGEIEDLADPLSEISEKYNFKVSPELRLIFLLITIYGPRAIMAANDRRINELENRVQKLEDLAKQKEEELKDKPENTEQNQ